MLARLFRRRDRRDAAHLLYTALVTQAREPVFYLDFQVPDSLDGRFDMVSLHAFLVLDRLSELPALRDLAQETFDLMFRDFDRNLREMGVGDLTVPKRIKDMAEAFYGRVKAYGDGLKGQGEGDDPLAAALIRNLYRGKDPGPAVTAPLAAYVRQVKAHLSAQDPARLELGQVDFGPAPGGA